MATLEIGDRVMTDDFKTFQGVGSIIGIDLPHSRLKRFIVKFDEIKPFRVGANIKGLIKMNEEEGICMWAKELIKI